LPDELSEWLRILRGSIKSRLLFTDWGMADGQPEGILELTLMGHPTLQVECSTHFGVLQKKAGRRSPPGLELVTV
jgi:hypothetical protein